MFLAPGAASVVTDTTLFVDGGVSVSKTDRYDYAMKKAGWALGHNRLVQFTTSSTAYFACLRRRAFISAPAPSSISAAEAGSGTGAGSGILPPKPSR